MTESEHLWNNINVIESNSCKLQPLVSNTATSAKSQQKYTFAPNTPLKNGKLSLKSDNNRKAIAIPAALP